MFDLPVKTDEEKHAYRRFHGFLLKDGFDRMQYSVYIRCCPSPENAEVHLKRIGGSVPPEGQVRIMQLTDKQFERMKVYQGKIRKKPEKPPTQLTLF